MPKRFGSARISIEETTMRRSALILLAQLATAAPLAAQFEGTVTARLSNVGPADEMMMKVAMKGDRQVTTVTMPASAGPMAGLEMRAIYDPKANTLTSLVPLPPMMQQMAAASNAKGIKNVTDLSNAGNSGSSDDKLDVKKLGTHEKIAGFECDDYEITPANGKPARACITQALGHFMFPQTGNGMGRRGGNGGAPAWSQAFGGHPGFPLKVWNSDGQTMMEVTSVDRGTVAASLFEIPEGYVDMATLLRGRGGH
jgi:hypothetical protein